MIAADVDGVRVEASTGRRPVALGAAEDLADEPGVELVAGAVGDDVADQIGARKGEVADHVEELVADALVGEA